ncbi:MAG TPA: patatin-like phospholipase family protein [Tepidisphaeraceae bacterium]|jgi:predicted patatin/cPLA2 family phospholipase|nr:patatin-like phospholipase family protein [Tepidisphaeraceae bacterium]
MPTQHSIAVLFVIAICFAGGCTAPSQSAFRGLSPSDARALARRMAESRQRELDEDLRSAFALRPPRNVLVLSGGDEDGAFGAGILHGWRKAPGGRPTFDVVTGVSTGALMATFAFLGEPRDDDALRDVYTHTSNADVFRIFAPGSFDAVLDTEPLKRLIARYVTADVINRVAAAHRKGRRLYVATFDLDADQLVVWPLSRLAAQGGENCLQQYRQILLAAASVPVLFPPVTIDGDLHVDAGLREILFVRSAMLGIGKAFDANAAHHDQPPTVYAIVNGPLRETPQAVPDGVMDIGLRSLNLFIESQQIFNLREAAHVALSHKPPFGFKYLAESDALQQESDSAVAIGFDPARMKILYDAGLRLGEKAGAWNEGLPALDGDPSVAGAASNFR